MDEHSSRALAERVERLEREVEELRTGLRRTTRNKDGVPAAEPRRVTNTRAMPTALLETATAARPGFWKTARERYGKGWSLSMSFDVEDLRRGEW